MRNGQNGGLSLLAPRFTMRMFMVVSLMNAWPVS
jgi:hypothetical protein